MVSNASGGARFSGAAQPMFLFGSKVSASVIGQNPVIDSASTSKSNLRCRTILDPYMLLYCKIGFVFRNRIGCHRLIITSRFQFSRNQTASNTCLMTLITELTEFGISISQSFRFNTTIKFESLGGHTMIQIISFRPCDSDFNQ